MPPLAPIAALVGSLLVEGTGHCPSADAVARRLAPLLSGGAAPAGTIELFEEKEGLRILRRDRRGAIEEERVIAPGPCDELAEGAAVVIAAWVGEAPSAAPGLSLPAGDPEHPPLGPRAEPPRRRHVDLAVAALLSTAVSGSALSSADLAPGASAEVGLSSPGICLGGRFALGGTGTRSRPLGSGSAEWTRLWLAAGPRCRLGRGRGFFEVRAEALLALVIEHGAGFPFTADATDVDFGLGGGLRGGVRLGRGFLFVEAGLAGWLRSQQVTGGGASAELPRLEAFFSLGGGGEVR